jgi:cell wall-associated NlpC family hydrolase
MSCRLALACALVVGCSDAQSQPAAPVPAPRPEVPAGERWDAAVADLEARRVELAERYAGSRGADRAAVLAEASATFLAAADQLIEPWLGTPWGLGSNSTARRPHEPGMTVGCSYFVTSVLQGAGVALDNRYHFAQAASLKIQRSLVGGGRKAVHRFLSIPPAELADKIAALGDGLYLIGLNIHVGFVRVKDGDVRFIHASYTGGQVVSDEPLATSQAIANSQPAGYFVSPLVTRDGLADDWLVERWLRGDTVKFDPKR